MRTPKRLYAQQRLIYQPELLTCPHCGDLLVMCNYLAWNKTVQTLDGVLSVASRPGRCPHETCAGSRLRLLSAEAQSIALPHSTYGYDVLVRIGWWRYQHHATYREMHAELASHVRISVAHVRYLYQQVYLPLLACHERQHRDRLAQIAQAQGGLILALDGLAPEGGEPQLWFMRELTSGLTLRSGWLSQQDHTTFEAFLQPLTQLEWPILAVLSDKQTGLMPAVTTVLPKSRYQFCQAHYLRNLAEPLAEADAAFKVDLRKAVRQQVGDVIRKEPRATPAPIGVLTVTGLLPSPIGPPPAPVAREAQSPPPTTTAPICSSAWPSSIKASSRRCRPVLQPVRHSNKGRPGSVTSPTSESPRGLNPARERRWPSNCAAISIRSDPGPISPQPSVRLAIISTRSAGVIGPGCSTATTCRGCPGRTTRSKAGSAIPAVTC